MITIPITMNEKSRLIFFAERVTTGGHWGGSEIDIPDEQILLQKLREADDSIELSGLRLLLLLEWIAEGTDTGTYLMSEDISIIKKIYEAVSDYHQRVENHFHIELRQIQKLFHALDKLTGKEDDILLAPKGKKDPARVNGKEPLTGEDYSKEKAPFVERDESALEEKIVPKDEEPIKYKSRDDGKEIKKRKARKDINKFFKDFIARIETAFSSSEPRKGTADTKDELKETIEKTRLLAKKISKKR